jgi:hypothetical protein
MNDKQYIKCFVSAVLAADLLEDYSYMQQCAIGFSGVLFAMKVKKGYVRYLSTLLSYEIYRYKIPIYLCLQFFIAMIAES